MREAAKGLDFLNDCRDPSGSGTGAGIQHKDVKPQNLLLIGGAVKVADFGLARLLQHTVTAATGGLTPAYAAPEFFNNQGTRWSDQYCLAVSYCQLRGGQLPFQGPPMQVMAGHLGRRPDLTMLPAAEQPVVARALSKKPKERWPSCRELVQALHAAVSGPVAGGSGRGTVPLPQASGMSNLAAPTVLPSQRPVPGKQIGTKAPPHLPAQRPEQSRRWVQWLFWLPQVLLLVVAVIGGWSWLSRTPLPTDSTSSQTRAPATGRVDPVSGVPKPGLLDCTGVAGVSPDEVRRAQQAWAKYLGRPVEETIEIANGVAMTFVLISPGKFRMGSPEGEKDRVAERETLHEVVLTEPFYLARTEVTQAQYEALTGENPSKFKGADRPVEQVSWEQARDYAAQLTKKRDDKHLYRLPTEAEWEYSCRGGRPSSQPFGIGDGHALSSREANFNGNFPYSGPKEPEKKEYPNSTCRVASYAANALGLYDMHGNVLEWCADWYGPYPSGAVTDPTGPAGGSDRVDRGGCWDYDAGRCRAANRDRNTPSSQYPGIGFRLARSVPSGAQ
jgi:formylglycine-generating enzyme required for sulfatase activity